MTVRTQKPISWIGFRPHLSMKRKETCGLGVRIWKGFHGQIDEPSIQE